MCAYIIKNKCFVVQYYFAAISVASSVCGNFLCLCTARVVAALQNNILLLWCVMSVKLNIGKKKAELEIMTLNCEKKCSMSSNLIELLSKKELHCLQECFRKPTGREDV